MTLLELVAEVANRTQVDRAEIFKRALEAWPNTYDFKPVQCRLLENTLKRGTANDLRGS